MPDTLTFGTPTFKIGTTVNVPITLTCATAPGSFSAAITYDSSILSCSAVLPGTREFGVTPIYKLASGSVSVLSQQTTSLTNPTGTVVVAYLVMKVGGKKPRTGTLHWQSVEVVATDTTLLLPTVTDLNYKTTK